MAPTIYAEWIELIERFEGGDDSVLAEMKEGDLEWTNVVAQRWTVHVSRAMTSRLQSISQRLQLGFTRSGGDLFAVAQAMLGARRSLSPLVEFASLSCMSPAVASHLMTELQRFVEESQAALERSAVQHGRSGEPVLRVIRENRLRLVGLSKDGNTQGSNSEPAIAQGPNRRRNLLEDMNG
jgi:hypothetical protein